MADIRGLIIPRSYNEYINKTDPKDIHEAVRYGTDSELSTASEQPVQNKVIAALIPAGTTSDNKLINESGIMPLIPPQATESNQLADKDYVNSTVGTNTAKYIYKTEVGGEKIPFSSIAELESYTGTVTQNDYAFVTGIDENGNIFYDRYKADETENGIVWAKEYRLNNSSFTSNQWAAINSGITASLIAELQRLTIQGIFDVLLPVNKATKVQFPVAYDMETHTVMYDTEDPNVTYNGNGITSTWVELDYDGAFFRSNGGLAQNFDGQTTPQAEGLPNISGGFFTGTPAEQLASFLTNGATGCFTTSDHSNYVLSYKSSSYGGGPARVNFSAKNSNAIYGASSHVTPTNYTIKVWLRTA